MVKTFLHLKPAKTEEITPAAQVDVLASFLEIGKRSLLDRLTWQAGKELSLEVISFDQKTHFYMVPAEGLEGYFTSQLLSHYPRTVVYEEKDPLQHLARTKTYSALALKLTHSYVYPLKTFRRQEEIPPFASVLGFFSKLTEGQVAVLQIVLRVPEQNSLQRNIRSKMKTMTPEGVEKADEHHALMQQKLTTPLLQVQIRLLFGGADEVTVKSRLNEFAGAFGVYTLGEGNSLGHKKVKGGAIDSLVKAVTNRSQSWRQPTLILNLDETASLWHLPDKALEGVKNIDWGKTVLSEAPDDLPVAERLTTDEAKREINFFGRTEWRNHEAVFGISRKDRRKHMYLIGKTGAGKSTLIANMAINDIRNGEGVAVIDPHGDLCEMILDYVPKRRMQDVIYLDPTLGGDRAFSLNLFDAEGAAHTDVVASGIVSVFHKLYAHSWGPRLEYILRNTVLSLLYAGDATFADIPRILTQKEYRNRIVAKIAPIDSLLAEFWQNEFDKMNEKFQSEAIAPVLNKVGQFLSSQRIRHIVGHQKSSFSLDEVMKNKKILLLNLSQGKLGEDTTALLGAMFITKMQLTAMGRVNLSPEDRPDFYLYVDEFQNFATQSFVKILSEARKYRLNLIMANQYIGQVDEDIQKAIFGNVGTLLSFVVGAKDAELLEREFGGVFKGEDLVGLGKFETLLKMSINELTSTPFMARTLPLPSVVNEQKDKIIRLSTEKYYRKI